MRTPRKYLLILAATATFIFFLPGPVHAPPANAGVCPGITGFMGIKTTPTIDLTVDTYCSINSTADLGAGSCNPMNVPGACDCDGYNPGVVVSGVFNLECGQPFATPTVFYITCSGPTKNTGVVLPAPGALVPTWGGGTFLPFAAAGPFTMRCTNSQGCFLATISSVWITQLCTAGGVALPIDKFTVLAPLLAAIGLGSVAAATVLVTVYRRQFNGRRDGD